MTNKTAKLIEEHKKDFSIEWQKDMRRQYLHLYYSKAFHKKYLNSKKYITDTVIAYWHYMGCMDSAVEKMNLVSIVYLKEEMNKLANILVKYQNNLYFSRKNKGNKITKELIERAANFPFEKLLDIKHGKALCPFHNDTMPSFSVKNNKGHCFSCGWHGDVVDYIMQKEGLDFRQAIKKLG